MTTRQDACTLAAELTVELATLTETLTTYEARVSTINCGQKGNRSLRARYEYRVNELRRAGLGAVAAANVQKELNRLCDNFVAAIRPIQDAASGWSSHPGGHA